MKARTQNDFDRELREAQEKLRELGWSPDELADLGGGGGVKCDFDLPYSTLPAITKRKRWNRFNSFPRR